MNRLMFKTDNLAFLSRQLPVPRIWINAFVLICLTQLAKQRVISYRGFAGDRQRFDKLGL